MIWNVLQWLHDCIGRYLNKRKTLSWNEAKRWNKVSQAIMKLQYRAAPERCPWIERKE